MRENHYAIVARLKISYVSNYKISDASYITKMSWTVRRVSDDKVSENI